MTDTGVPQICPIGNAPYYGHNEDLRWCAPEVLLSCGIIPEAPVVWSFGMTIYVSRRVLLDRANVLISGIRN